METIPVQPQSAFTAFEAQLRTLCLNEFPCGRPVPKTKGKRTTRVAGRSVKELGRGTSLTDPTRSRFAVTLQDLDPQQEKTESLEELISSKKSPWNQDYSWSDEARSLREIAIKSPWLLDERFILSHFKSLRIVDQGITEVDESFLKFTNLEQLTLSANKLKTVHSNNLPQDLEVLELCANEISHLEDLCRKTNPLMHLGLGHNLLTLVDDYLTGHYWPCLLSLDLSHNNLADLMEVVSRLKTLPKLRNLLLQGNPLSLIPGYRGYVVDSLRELDFLDDTPLSADEKHHYKGLAKHKEYILDEAKIRLRVDYIHGLLQPEELRLPDEQPEFPIITRKYYVQFMFQAGEPVDVEDSAESVSPQADVKPEAEPQDTVSRATNTPSLSGQLPGETAEEEDSPADVISTRTVASSVRSGDLEESQVESKLSAVRSADSTWINEIELNWQEVLVRDNLLALRDFFKDGIDIAVMEETVLSYPADQVQDGVITPSGRDKKPKKKKVPTATLR